MDKMKLLVSALVKFLCGLLLVGLLIFLPQAVWISRAVGSL